MTIALRVGRRDHDTEDFPLSVDAGSYTLTGTAAGLSYGREIASTNGSYALTGTAAAFLRSRRIVATNGSYAITGTTAGLNYSGGDSVFAWDQVDFNDGYRIEWDTNSGVPYANSHEVAQDVTTYDASLGAGTYYWRVAALAGGFPQTWTSEQSFTI